ncbi:MAG: hypothetical protein Q8M03_05465, partial [Legionella sp.]|nr:hypothetical protein [Legionella sp.]
VGGIVGQYPVIYKIASEDIRRVAARVEGPFDAICAPVVPAGENHLSSHELDRLRWLEEHRELLFEHEIPEYVRLQLEAQRRCTKRIPCTGTAGHIVGGSAEMIAITPRGATRCAIDMPWHDEIGALISPKSGPLFAAFVDAGSNPYSRLRLYGDRVEVGIPGVTGGGYIAPFSVQNVNGIAQVAVTPNVIPDDAIDTRTLASGAASAFSTFSSADVTRTMAAWNASGAGAVVLYTEIQVSAGSALLIDFDTALVSSTDDTESNDGWFDILVNGVSLGQIEIATRNSSIYYGFKKTPFSTRKIATDLPAGLCTVTVQFCQTAGYSTGVTVTTKTPKLIMEEKKKPLVTVAAASIPTPAVTYRTSSVGGTSGTFSGVSIGTASAYRTVVVALRWKANSTWQLPTITIGGITASRIQWGYDGGSVALYSARVPTGTTADIIATMHSSAVQDINISVWTVTCFNAGAVQSGWDHGNAAALTGAVSPISGDVIICAAVGDSTVTGFAGAMSVGTLTEDVDAGTGVIRYAGYSMIATATSAQT